MVVMKIVFGSSNILELPLQKCCEKIVLGEVEYFGRKALAVREVYPAYWKFVVYIENEKVELLTY